MITSAKEAREILSNQSALPPGRPILKEDWAAAEAYLAALEGPEVKILIEALEDISPPSYHGSKICPCEHADDKCQKALDAIAQYRQAVKP